MAYTIKKGITSHYKQSGDKGVPVLVIQRHNASIKNSGSFYLSPLPSLSSSSGWILSWLQDGCCGCRYHNETWQCPEEKKRTAFPMCPFFFFLKEKVPKILQQIFSHASLAWITSMPPSKPIIVKGNRFMTHPWGWGYGHAEATNSFCLPQAASTLNFWLKSFAKENIGSLLQAPTPEEEKDWISKELMNFCV